jgi:hypothetical protein
MLIITPAAGTSSRLCHVCPLRRSKIASLVFWPVFATFILCVCFAQMMYTVAQINCAEAMRDWSVCSVRESYIVIYYLFVGEPVAYIDGQSSLGKGIGLLSLLFSVAVFVILSSILCMVVMMGSRWDIDNLALISFWEPKLTFVVTAVRPRTALNNKTTAALASVWDIATHILLRRNSVKGTYWYARFAQKPALAKLCYWLITAAILPLWLLVGALTLGMLWPPQVRRFLFRPQMAFSAQTSRGKLSPTEAYTSQVSSMRQELVHIRDMSFERSNDVQREVRDLKEILLLVTTDE